MIPTQLEKLILSGKASFETYQIGITEFNVIPVQSKEFIVVIGYDFYAANDVSIDGVATNQKVPQKIEFYDGFRYNHFVHKMMDVTGSSAILQDQRMVSNDGLYMLFKRDVGISITIPRWNEYNWSNYVDTLDGATGKATIPTSAAQIINDGVNEYTTTPISSLAGTEMATPEVSSIPLNRTITGGTYSDQYTNGPYNLGFDNNQFNFSPEARPTSYINTTFPNAYQSVTPEQMNRAFFLNVKYVRVFEEADTNIR